MTQAVAYERPEPFTVPEGGLASFLTATVGDWADDDDYTPIPSSGIAQVQQVADKLSEFGRNEDTYMVHAAEGETVIPTAIFDANPKLKATLFKQMEEMGLEPERYVIGNELNSLNPVTGQPEFFFKKIFKGIKKAVKGVVKVFKKIAPVVLPIALGFTGLGPIFGPMVGSGIASLIQGKSLGKSLKSALISGAVAGLGTGLAGGFQGLKPGGVGFGEGFTSSIGNALSSPGARFSTLGRGLMPGSDTPLFSTKYLTGDPSTFGQAGAGTNAAQTPNLPAFRDGAGNVIDPTGANAPVMRLPEARGLKLTTGSGFSPANQPIFGPPAYTRQASNLPMAGVRADSFPMANTQSYVNPTLKPNTVSPLSGAGESRTGFQKFRDYMVRGGKSPEEVLAAQNAAKAEYLKLPSSVQSPEGLTKFVADAGPSTLQRFGPSVALGTGIFSAAGGFDVPEEEEIDRGPTGEELYDADPEAYGYMDPRTYASTYNAPNTYSNVYVPTLFAAGGGEASFPRRMGAISGPGTGTSDDVPAMLSDGEFVMTADAVRGAGGGSRQKGMNNMYAMMRRFEGGAV